MENKSVMWRNDRMSCGQILHMEDCHVEINSPHENCEENLWRNNVHNLWCLVEKSLFSVLHCFVAKSVLL